MRLIVLFVDVLVVGVSCVVTSSLLVSLLWRLIVVCVAYAICRVVVGGVVVINGAAYCHAGVGVANCVDSSGVTIGVVVYKGVCAVVTRVIIVGVML